MSISLETLRLKVRDRVSIPVTKRSRRKTLASTEFSIISNNCWGGTVYESYGLRKQSPTVGMFIMPKDFVLLASDLSYHLAQPLEFLRPDESKWVETLGSKANWGAYLIGRVGEVELHMLHHHETSIARAKWNNRIERVSMNRVVFKLNDQNGCTDEDARRFDSLAIDNKLYFTVRDRPGISCSVMIRSPKSHDYVRASYEPIGANPSFNVTQYLNSRLTD